MEASEPVRVSRRLKISQALFGFIFWFTLVLPYVRRIHGRNKILPGQRHLFVCNHVSLLDTLLLGTILWRSGHCPILVLGDKNVWDTSAVKRLLSRPIGFLVERGKLNPGRMRELQAFARAAKDFSLIVFPEGTRGNGVDVAECQPGIYYIAQAARVPVVPVFITNMQLVSTKGGPFHPFSGLRKVEVHFGDRIAPEDYLPLARREFTELVRQKIAAAGSRRYGVAAA